MKYFEAVEIIVGTSSARNRAIEHEPPAGNRKLSILRPK